MLQHSPIPYLSVILFSAVASADTSLLQATLNNYCVGCHSDQLSNANLNLNELDLSELGEQIESWEKVVAKLRARTMPPAGKPRPANKTYDNLASVVRHK